MGLQIYIELLSAGLSGIALIMIVWQVNYEKNNNIKQNQVEMAIEKQGTIMNWNREFLFLINERTQLLLKNKDSFELTTIELKIRDLMISMGNENEICELIFNKYEIKEFGNIAEYTKELSKAIESGSNGEEIIEQTKKLAAYNFHISNKCKENIKILLQTKNDFPVSVKLIPKQGLNNLKSLIWKICLVIYFLITIWGLYLEVINPIYLGIYFGLGFILLDFYPRNLASSKLNISYGRWLVAIMLVSFAVFSIMSDILGNSFSNYAITFTIFFLVKEIYEYVLG